jgi:UDP-glucuronate 4-epimerase
MAETYHYLYGLQVTGLRFFTVYGPWGRPDMAYFSFAKAIIEGQPIDVFAEGKLQRDFTYIDDIIQGTIAAVDLSSPCALFNLGNHQPVEVNELIALLELSLGKKAIKRFLPMQAGDMEKTYADISESTQKLGFVPKTSLAKGIERFVTWFKNYQG